MGTVIFPFWRPYNSKIPEWINHIRLPVFTTTNLIHPSVISWNPQDPSKWISSRYLSTNNVQRPDQRPQSRKKLGPLISIYGDRPLRWRDLTTRYIPGALIALVPFFYGLWRVDYALTRFGPAAGYSWGRPWFLLSSIVLIPLLSFALRRIRRAHRLIIVHKNGFRIKQNRVKNRVILWRDISGISTHHSRVRFLGIPLDNRFQAVIHPHIGEPVRLDPRIPHLAELSARIKGKIYPGLLAELREQKSNGKNLYFGPIILNQEGITIRDKSFPWQRVTQINVDKGFLFVHLMEQRTKKIPVRDILNIEILIQLIQEGVAA